MALAGVAAAAPKDERGPEQAQGNGPPSQAQPNGLPVQAQPNGSPDQARDPAPAPKGQAKGHGRQGSGAPADIPRDLPPQAGGNGHPGPAVGQSHQGDVEGGAGDHGRPSTREPRGHKPTDSNPAANGGANEQPGLTGGQQGAEADVLGVSEGRPNDDRAETVSGERQLGRAPEVGSALGLNQGGAEDAGEARGSFDDALPFTGFELALLVGAGAMLGLAGVQLRRSTA